MQASLYRRIFPAKLVLVAIAIAVGLFVAGGSPVYALGNFNVQADVQLCEYTGSDLLTTCTDTPAQRATNNPADVTTDLLFPLDDMNFSSIVNFTPPEVFLGQDTNSSGGPEDFDGNEIPIGAVAGKLVSTTTLGVTNLPCGNVDRAGGPDVVTQEIPFLMMVSTTDINHTIDQTDPDLAGNETAMESMRDDDDQDGNPGEPEDNNQLPNHVDHYPSYLNDVFDPDRVGDINGDGDELDTITFAGAKVQENGPKPPMQPVLRTSGNAIAAGAAQELDFVFFAPGALSAFASPHPWSDLSDPRLGYSAMIVLNNPTEAADAPSAVTDFCSPLGPRSLMWGTTRINPCLANTAQCDALNDDTNCAVGGGGCGDNSSINSFDNTTTPGWDPTATGTVCTAGDGGGCVRYKNPSVAGTYLWYNWSQSQRDADGDGMENQIDTCPLNNTGDSTTGGYNTRDQLPQADDADNDLLPRAGIGGCDDDDNAQDGNNSDGDNAANGQPWPNAGDNCPLVTNTDNKDDEVNQPLMLVAPLGGPRADGIGDACDPDNATSDGTFHTFMKITPKCIGGTDADVDGYCDAGASLVDPNDADSNITPEEWAAQGVFTPLAWAGSGDSAPGPEVVQVCNDGVDNDGDGDTDAADTGCAGADRASNVYGVFTPGGQTADSDGDGFANWIEWHVGTDYIVRCAENGPEVGEESTTGPSSGWPGDLNQAGGFLPSFDRIQVLDITAFISPRRLDTDPGDPNFDQRYDLTPGKGFFLNTINIQDLTSLIALAPPMLGGASANNGPLCTDF